MSQEFCIAREPLPEIAATSGEVTDAPILSEGKARLPRRVIPVRLMPVAQQRSLAGRYPLWIKALSMIVFTWAFLGWLNETWFFKFNNAIWLNRYTEYVIILAFGLWRIVAEKNPYNRRRLIIL
ncbi:MAG: hypothetical protein HQL74_15980, partial [Magnetococcales bacterium]|nr:hypothetical protein [Magnetococcales bacterium]